MRLCTLLLVGIVVGCEGSSKDTGDTDSGGAALDIDGDGYSVEDGDCNDGDASVNPGADEVWYDGVDQNCDQLDDYDQDQDGAAADVDCNDEDPKVSPDAAEVCDGIDNDCNGEVDEAGELTAYLDADGDGFGTGEPLGQYCELPAGTASNDEDCNDTNAGVSPVAEEVCDSLDNDCDGEVDTNAVDGVMAYPDADGDGYGDPGAGATVCELEEGWVEESTDCDDADALTNPGAVELCDLKDNNCDGGVDEGSPDARTYYQDADADGYGDAAVTEEACGAPTGYVETGDDCDDSDAARSPGAAEVCDGVDNDCDGDVDVDPIDGTTVYADADADGYGDDATRMAVCTVDAGYVEVGGDCDDTAADANPGADEICDGLDNDCDGTTDESTAVDAATWYLDADADGYGDAGASTPSCEAPTGFVPTGDDCDDADDTVYPEAPELCDEIDNDCDGAVDDGADGLTTWYADVDGDGYGDAVVAVDACEQPSGYVSDDADCDDGDPGRYPGNSETCDGIDEDCDGIVDNDATDASIWYADVDGDGYGDASSTTSSCEQPSGYVSGGSDCDDDAPTSYPGASELFDGLDNDCDGTVDEDLLAEGDVIITEFARQTLFGGSSTNSDGAWFEVYNTTSADIDLSDWYITRYLSTVGRDAFYVDPADGVIVPANSYAVFCKDDDYTADVDSASDLVCDYFWGDDTLGSTSVGTYYDNTFNMQRDSDSLALYYGGDHTSGMLIDEVAWYYDATNGYWPRDSSRSAQLDRTALDSASNDDVDNWCSTTSNVFFQWYYVSASNREFGTPGIQNHTCP